MSQSRYNLHEAIAIGINVIIIMLIIYNVINSSSDKSPIIFMVFYPALIFLNFLLLILLWLLKVNQMKIYKQIIIAQLLLFFPLILIIAQF